MHVESVDETVVRVRIPDRLDLNNAEFLEERAEQCLDEGKRLLIQFEKQAFFDSHGVRTILELAEMAHDQLGENGLALVSDSRAADQVIEITRMGRMISVYESEEEAVDALSEYEPQG